MSFWGQALEVARTDLLVERRLGDTVRIVLPFGVIALLVFPFATGVNMALLGLIGMPVFWAVGVLFGMQIALRQSAHDTPPLRDLHAQLGLDPAARFIGRCLSGSLLLFAFLLVLLLAMAFIYDPDLPTHPAGYAGIAMFAFALTALATIAGDLTNSLRNRTALAPLIVAPLSAPLIIATSQLWVALLEGTTILGWMLVLAASGLGLLVLGVGSARSLEESAR